MRRLITFYLNVPVYAEFHRWLGRTEDLQPMWDAWESGDRKKALAVIPQKVMDELIVHGDGPEERVAHVQRFLDAGIDTVFLAFQSSEPDPVKKHQLILQAHRDMAPANQ
jgi:hypothetical protein